MKVLTIYAHPSPKSFCHAVLERFTRGLTDAGHTVEVVDLYALRFNPVFDTRDFAGWVHEDMPAEILAEMDLPKRILDSCRNPLERWAAGRWVQGKDDRALARFIRAQLPRDVRDQQSKIASAQGLAVIAPVYWCQFPAILKGYFERVFNYGFAFSLSPAGWQGDLKGRIPLLHHEKALLMTPTFFREEYYRGNNLQRSMKTLIDDWGFRYPGIKTVEHRFFYAVDRRNAPEYLSQAYELGRNFSARESEVGQAAEGFGEINQA